MSLGCYLMRSTAQIHPCCVHIDILSFENTSAIEFQGKPMGKKREKIHRPELRRVIQRKGYRMAVTCHRLNVIVVRSEWASHPPGSFFFFFFFFFFWSDAQYTGRKNKQTKTSTKNALREKERES